MMSCDGIVAGGFLYIWGVFFFDLFHNLNDPQVVISFTVLLFGIYKILGALLEVPTGAIGDVLGRKWSIVISFVFALLFFATMSIIPFVSNTAIGITLAVVSILFIALSGSFISGSMTAWIVDSIRHADHKMDYGVVISSALSVSFLSQIIGAGVVVLAYLNQIISAGFSIIALVCLGCIVYILLEVEESYHEYHTKIEISASRLMTRMGEIISVSIRAFMQSRALLGLVLVFVFFRSLYQIVDYLWPIYLKNNIPNDIRTLYWISLVVIAPTSCALGSKSVQYIKGRFFNKGTSVLGDYGFGYYLGIALLVTPILILSYLTYAQAPIFIFFAITIVITQFAAAMFISIYRTVINLNIPVEHSHERATIMSFAELVCSALIALIAIPSGGPSGQQTALGWAVPAILLIIVSVICSFTLLRGKNPPLEGQDVEIPDVTEVAHASIAE